MRRKGAGWPPCRVQKEGAGLPAGCRKKACWPPCSAQEEGCGLCQGHNYVSYDTFFCVSDLYIKTLNAWFLLHVLYIYIYISFLALETDNFFFFKNAENIKHQWANTSTYPINKSF